MSVVLSVWWAAARAATPAEGPGGAWDGEIAFDVLHATSRSTAPSSGPTPALSSTELGMRIRGSVASGGVVGALDYQGREAVAGTFQTLPFRLVYRAEVVGTVAREHLDLAAGRFLAPSVVFLPVDGARLAWRPDERWTMQLFGGRRGISTARRNLGFDTFLPAVGGAGGYLSDRGAVDLLLSYASDQVALPVGDVEAPFTDTFGSLSGTVRGRYEPIDDDLSVGASGTALQRASFVFLPTPGSAEITAEALDLFQGLGYVRWRAADPVRIDLDVLHQTANIAFAGADTAPEEPGVQLPSGVNVTIVDPTFTDLRARGAVRVLDAAWVRPDVRLRLRTGRTELRYGLGADIDRLFVPGPFLRGRFWLEDIGQGGEGDDVGAVDRLLWSGSGGWSRGPFEAEVGASRVDRAAAPVSSRTASATASDDLSPFVLAAQDVGFVRAFVTNRTLFGGLDLEANLTAEPEVRAFVQVGVLGDGRW